MFDDNTFTNSIRVEAGTEEEIENKNSLHPKYNNYG